MSDNLVEGVKISQMTPLVDATGEIWFEVSQRPNLTSQQWNTRRISLAQIQGTAKSAYQVAVENGFFGTVQQWLNSLKGENGKSAYQLAVDLGYNGSLEQWLESLKDESIFEKAKTYGWQGTEAELYAKLLADAPDVEAGTVGSVYITDVRAASTGNVGNKVTSSDGHTLESCSTTTNTVIVKVEALSGPSSFKPVVSVAGSLVNMTLMSPTGSRWSGEVEVTISGPGPIEATHGDGGSTMVQVTMDTAPTITNATFVNPYPGTQTELKEGDQVNISITADQPFVAYEVENYGALKAASGPSTGNVAGLVVADRGNTATTVGFRVRVQKASGAWSAWFTTNTMASPAPGVHTVVVNNLKPTITLGNIVYSAGLAALKNGTYADVNATVTNHSSVQYTTDGTISVDSPNAYNAIKRVNYVSGNYNDSAENLTITATRAANGSSTTARAVVKIANVAPTVTVTVPYARLRSGGNSGTAVQQYDIVLNSNQQLAAAPSLNAPGGTWAGDWTSSNSGKTWTRKLAVHDNDAKGTYTFNNLVATNIGGVAQNSINGSADYVLGGFVFRVLTVPPFPNRVADIGTTVINTSKLRCTNLSKGSTGSLNFTYKSDQAGLVNAYTIVGDNTWYNCDDANASSNSAGLMQIELEEVV